MEFLSLYLERRFKYLSCINKDYWLIDWLIADVSPRETSLAARSEEQGERLFSQVIWEQGAFMQLHATSIMFQVSNRFFCTMITIKTPSTRYKEY